MPHAASMQQTVDRILAGIDSGFIPSSVQFIPQPIFLFSTILYSYPWGAQAWNAHLCKHIDAWRVDHPWVQVTQTGLGCSTCSKAGVKASSWSKFKACKKVSQLFSSLNHSYPFLFVCDLVPAYVSIEYRGHNPNWGFCEIPIPGTACRYTVASAGSGKVVWIWYMPSQGQKGSVLSVLFKGKKVSCIVMCCRLRVCLWIVLSCFVLFLVGNPSGTWRKHLSSSGAANR